MKPERAMSAEEEDVFKARHVYRPTRAHVRSTKRIWHKSIRRLTRREIGRYISTAELGAGDGSE